jgi:hypothetical protein
MEAYDENEIFFNASYHLITLFIFYYTLTLFVKIQAFHFLFLFFNIHIISLIL